MKISKFAFAAAVAGLLMTGSIRAFAQGVEDGGTVVESNSYYANSEDKPAPKPATPAPAAEAPAAEAPAEEEAKEEPWSLQKHLNPCGNCHDVTWGGYMEAGYTFNNFGDQVPFNGPVAYNDRNEELMLNQFDFFVNKAVDTKGCGWAFGGRLEMIYGRDALFIQSTGLELNDDGTRHWNGERFYGLAMEQAYGEIGYNDLDVKLGKMVTPLEYEVIDPRGNFFYSHSYGFLYAVPFTNTGGIGTYKYSDHLTFLGGVVNGWDRVDGLTDRAALIGGFVYKGPCDKGTLTFNIISGDELNLASEATNRTAYSLVFDYKLSEKTEYVLVHDLGWQRDYFGAGQDASWYGLNNYLMYTINDCWKAGLRAEWFRDNNGARVAGAGASAGSSTYAGGSDGNFYEISAGLNWMPHASQNIKVRPEVRYDWFDGTGTRPFDNEQKSYQWTVALDAIVTY